MSNQHTNNEMKILRKLCLSGEKKKIQEYLSEKNADELLEILEGIIEDEYIVYEPAIEIISEKWRYGEELPLPLLKDIAMILKTNNPKNEAVDNILAQIYEKDKAFVVGCLRERLIAGNIPVATDFLKYIIQSTDYSPVIQMLEKEIDKRNHTMLVVGDEILSEFFPSENELFEWCKKWKEDKRKKRVVLLSLKKILTKMLDHQYLPLEEKSILLVKEFAEKEGLNYAKITKNISFFNDPHRESIMKALKCIDILLHPPIHIDSNELKENLKNYPHLNKAIGEYLVRSLESGKQHPLAVIYSKKIDYNKMEELRKILKSEDNEDRKIRIEWQYKNLIYFSKMQEYWEEIFKILCKQKLDAPLSKKLRNLDTVESILAEAEVVARLARYFEVKLEPDIPELRPNKLDAEIEFRGEKALIEIRSIKEPLEFSLVGGAIVSVPGRKVKNVLLDKFKKQLKAGKLELKIPIILILHLDNFLDNYNVENAIYGELQYSIKVRRNTGDIIEERPVRAKNSFYDYDLEGTDIVTAIIAYKRDYTGKNKLIGKIYDPPSFVTPRNPMHSDFRMRLCKALFEEDEYIFAKKEENPK